MITNQESGVRGQGICFGAVMLAASSLAFCAQPYQPEALARNPSLANASGWYGCAHAQGPKAKADVGHDFVFLAEAQPLLVRVHVRVDGKTLQEAHAEFMMHLFRYLDVKGQGYLGKNEVERAPLVDHIKTGSLGSMFGGYMPGTLNAGPPTFADYAAKHAKDGKVTWTDLARYYQSHGLVPFQLQGEVAAGNSGIMIALGDMGATEPTVAEVSAAIFARLDSKKNGRLAKAELAATPELLLKLDTNEDEMITIGELVPPSPRKGGDGMMGMSRGIYGNFAPKASAPKASRVFLIPTPGEVPADLAARMQGLYAPEDAQADAAALVKRAPDLEFIVHLGDAKGVEVVNKKGKPGGLADKLKAFDGLALLDLPKTRVEFRGDGASAADSFAPFVRLQYTALFKQADKEGRGYITQQQAGMFAGAFKAMDRDGDGKVTEQEFNAYLELVADLHARAKKACVSLVLTDESRGLFDLLDVNRDGRLSLREMRGAVGLLAKLQCEKKGYIEPADLPRSYRLTVRSGPADSATDDYSALLTRIYGGGGKAQTYREPTRGPLWFRKMDKNRDGDVSRREWLGSEELFRQIDTDGDGLISADEADRFDARSRKR
jgi:Ca2+-binding EF-hand superfamily protein